ncbi:MAG: MFS transporter [Actinomycetota bacterium]|nr:MAG: MFS transporter [Actinomycetota bacterium]
MTSSEFSSNTEDRDITSEPMRPRPILLAIGIAISAVLPVFLTGALAVQIKRDLDFTPSHLGAAVAVFFLFAALSSFISGRISHRVNDAKVIRACMIASSLVLLGIGTVARNYPVLVVLLAVAGTINGSLQPSINLFISRAIPRRRQGLAFGVKQAAVPLATFLAGLAVPTIALTIGWRYAFLGVAPLGIIFFFMSPRSIQPVEDLPANIAEAERPSAAPILMLAIGMGLGTGAANAFAAFLVSFAVHAGWKPGLAGLLIVFGSVIGVTARVGHGLLADRRHGRHFLFATWSAAIGGLGYLMFVLGYGWLIIPATVVSYGAGWGWNGLFIFAVVRNFTKFAGYATGTVQSGAYIGSVIGPLGFGFAVEKAGYPFAWSLAALSAFAAAIAVAIARRLVLSREPGAVG